jgi:23S rRNA G2445 N2-methylase RlmL
MVTSGDKKRDLAAAVRSPGFTPSVRDAAALVAMLASDDDDELANVERALVRLGDAALDALERARDTKPPMRARVVRAIGRRAAESERARAMLVVALGDDDVKTRRNAIVALGKVHVAEDARAAAAALEDALLAAWDRETRVDVHRSLAASLGKIGGARALERLRAIATDDAELRRIVDRAMMMLDRTSTRGEESGVDDARAPAIPTQVLLHCRDGVEKLLAEEAELMFEARVSRPGRVVATLRGPMRELWSLRTMTRFGFPLPQQWLRDGEDAGDALVRAIASQEAKRIFATFTRGAVRYRIAWGGGGHRRAVVWRSAKRIAEIEPMYVNDPTDSTWEVVVHQQRRFVDVEVMPRLDDPRFAYRVGDVPAASHPTLAAALARVAGVRADDVVWDPFVGSGTELVERARAGAFARLVGTDVDAEAIATAQANLDAAGVRAELVNADATTFAPRGVTLVISNPPMGRRVVRTTELGKLLDRIVDRAAELLAPGGRLVWISPFGERTRARAEAAGLVVDYVQDVDMGGFVAELQRIKKKGARVTRAKHV